MSSKDSKDKKDKKYIKIVSSSKSKYSTITICSICKNEINKKLYDKGKKDRQKKVDQLRKEYEQNKLKDKYNSKKIVDKILWVAKENTKIKNKIEKKACENRKTNLAEIIDEYLEELDIPTLPPLDILKTKNIN